MRIRETEDMYELIELTKSTNAKVRLEAAKSMCPCHVLEDDIPEFWERLFQLAHDEDAKVRFQAMHDMCDGSPTKYEEPIMECIDFLARDKDADVRRTANKVQQSYKKYGKYNIM